jgi:hypothetical protein
MKNCYFKRKTFFFKKKNRNFYNKNFNLNKKLICLNEKFLLFFFHHKFLFLKKDVIKNENFNFLNEFF